MEKLDLQVMAKISNLLGDFCKKGARHATKIREKKMYQKHQREFYSIGRLFEKLAKRQKE